MPDEHSVPMSDEVAAEHVERCDCASCTFYRDTRDICESGTPDARAARLGYLNVLLPMVIDAVRADFEAGRYGA